MDAVRAISRVGKAQKLTPEQQAAVERLQATDRDVRSHERAHLAAAGTLANAGVDYTYETGPDGKLYAVSGKVKIAVPTGLTPEEQITAARQILAAEDSPSDPSGQDFSMAARARQLEIDAQQKVEEQKRAKEDQNAQNSQPSALSILDSTA